MTNRTVTLPTADHGDITLPEPAWCVGHESVPGDLRAEIFHQGPDVVLRFRGQFVSDAGLVQSPYAADPTPSISVSMLGRTLDPRGVYELAAELDRHADALRDLADQLSALLGGDR